jgi:hypothetical protein
MHVFRGADRTATGDLFQRHKIQAPIVTPHLLLSAIRHYWADESHVIALEIDRIPRMSLLWVLFIAPLMHSLESHKEFI